MPPFAENNLSDRQERLLSLLPIIPSILSVVGSMTIIRLVRRSKSQGPYKRILFGMSVCDALASIVWPLQGFLLPRDTSSRVWAVGNSTTCSALGFVQQLSFASFFYSGMLSFYFVATIRFGVRGDSFARYMEPWIHFVAVGYPLVTAVIGAALGAYDEMDATLGCWVTGDDNSVKIGWAFVGFPFFIIFLFLVMNNLVIYGYVKRLLRHSSFISNREARQKRIQGIATQALLYIVPLAISAVWTLILRIKASYDLIESEADVYHILVLQSIFFPSFGFFNMIVFVRPRYLTYRSQHQDESRVQSIRQVLFLCTVIGLRPSPERTAMSNGAVAGSLGDVSDLEEYSLQDKSTVPFDNDSFDDIFDDDVVGCEESDDDNESNRTSRSLEDL